MNKIWDWIIDGLLGLFNFFGNISSRPNDDHLTAEYKQHQRACTAAVGFMVIACFFIVVISSLFENNQGSQIAGAMIDDMRVPVGIFLVTVFCVSFLYALYAFMSLFLFYRKYIRNN